LISLYFLLIIDVVWKKGIIDSGMYQKLVIGEADTSRTKDNRERNR